MDFYNISDSSYRVGTFVMPCTLNKSKILGKKHICSYFMVADIETSHTAGDMSSNKPQEFEAWSYQQGCALFDSNNGNLLEYSESRSILEFCHNFLKFNIEVTKKNGTGLIFFHNSKFDLRFFRQTLISVFRNYYNRDIKYEDFMIDTKTWLFFRIENIEIRCSARLTQQSLYSFTKDMAVKHRKLLGANDYGIHYSDEDLPQEFHDYMYNDVVGLGEAISKMLVIEDLTLASLPYTGTGFPRKDVKRNFVKSSKDLFNFIKSRPTINEYRVWEEAYAGGHTQCNEKYREIEVNNNNIKHRDFVSFYPSVIYTCPYPTNKGTPVAIPLLSEFMEGDDDKLLVEWTKKIEDMAYSENKLYMMRLIVCDYKINKDVMPFLPQAHIIDIEHYVLPTYYSHKLKYYHGMFSICLTTPDLLMLFEYSTFKYLIPVEIYEYDVGRMPKPILDTVKKYFVDKSVLKYKEKSAINTPKYDEIHSMYQRAKGKLNGIYGMLVERLIKYLITWSDDINDFVEEDDDVDGVPKYLREDVIKEALRDYYGTTATPGSCKTGKCLSYAHGCFVTAWARYLLFAFCDTIGWNNVLYCDTDSAFYISSPEIEEGISELNSELREQAELAEAFVDITLDDGTVKRTYLHYFDDENENIIRFKALNAKRYMYVYEDKHGKHLSLTSAGIAKGVGLHENSAGDALYEYTREMEIAGIARNNAHEPSSDAEFDKAFENFHTSKTKANAFCFKYCGGTTTAYTSCKPHYTNINGHTEFTEGGVAILGSVKALMYVNDSGSLVNASSLQLEDLIGQVGVIRLNSLEEKL